MSDKNLHHARALWYVAPQNCEIRHEDLGPLQAGSLRVRMMWSALSRGTERLIYNGLVPETIAQDMRAPFQQGVFPFPVKYGYCAVGSVIDGDDDLVGQTIFCLHPHQTYFDVPRTAVHLLPHNVPPKRAILAANMETALNAVWDSGVSAGERVLIIGAGIVGLLVTFLVSRLIGTEVYVCDIDRQRADIIKQMGGCFMTPDELKQRPVEADCVFHSSATQEGLNLALHNCGFEARVVEMSWYGDKSLALTLGAHFHARRLTLISSQVGAIAPQQRPRWDYARRLALALRLLADPSLDALLSDECNFDDMPLRIAEYLGPQSAHLTCAIAYKGN